jgi:hypothetical protein
MLRKTTFSSVAALVFLEASSAGVSSAEQAPISVSLVIQQSCVIQSVADPSSITAPRVACLHGEPYRVAVVPLEPAQTLSTMQFTAPGTQHAVWMVSF